MQVLARQVLLHHILIQPCHDNRDEDAAEKLLEEVLFAVPVVKNKDTAVFISRMACTSPGKSRFSWPETS